MGVKIWSSFAGLCSAFLRRPILLCSETLRTSCESLKNWELQIPSFEEFFWRGKTLGLVPASLPHALGYACTFYALISPPPKPSLSSYPGHLKPVISKPVGRMSVLGEFDLPGVVPGCFLGRPFCASKQGLQAPGSNCSDRSSESSDRKWPKTGHTDDWVYCDWV